MTVLSDFGNYLEQQGKSENTLKAYHRDLVEFVAWWEERTGQEFNANAVDSRDIVDYRTVLVKLGAKPATINRRLTVMRLLWDWGVRQGILVNNPFSTLSKVRVATVKNISPRWLDGNEQAALRRVVRGSGKLRDIAIFETLIGGGLRISEVVALEVSDLTISERAGSLRVRAVAKEIKERLVPLDNRTRQALSAWLKVRDETMGSQVFYGQRGPITDRAVDYLVRKYAYHAKLEDVSAHTLRHTFGKNLVNAGVSLDQVAALMGHESLETTKIYTLPSFADLQKAVRQGGGEVE